MLAGKLRSILHLTHRRLEERLAVGCEDTASVKNPQPVYWIDHDRLNPNEVVVVVGTSFIYSVRYQITWEHRDEERPVLKDIDLLGGVVV